MGLYLTSIKYKKQAPLIITFHRQVYELEKKFQRCQYLSAVDRLNLAAALSMSDVQVKIFSHSLLATNFFVPRSKNQLSTASGVTPMNPIVTLTKRLIC